MTVIGIAIAAIMVVFLLVVLSERDVFEGLKVVWSLVSLMLAIWMLYLAYRVAVHAEAWPFR